MLGDSAADHLLAAQLSAEDQTGEDHRLGHRIGAVDVSFDATLGEAGGLRFGQRVLVGAAVRHRREDEVAGRVEDPAQRGRPSSREALHERGQHRRSRHHRRLRSKRERVRARQLRELHPMKGDRPLVGGDHRHPASERLSHMGEARLAVEGTARDLDQHICFAGLEPLDRSRPVTDPGLVHDRRAAGEQSDHGRRVKPIPVIDETVTRVGNPHHRETDSVAASKSLPARVERPKQPLAHRA